MQIKRKDHNRYACISDYGLFFLRMIDARQMKKYYIKVGFVCKNTKIWMKAAIMRAIRTIAQTFVATVGTAAVMSEVNWKIVISATVLAGFLSIATSLTGLPECEEKE